MKNLCNCFLLIYIFTFSLKAQDVDLNALRKVVLSSDVILAGNYDMTLNYLTDFSSETVYSITEIDSMILNRTGFKKNHRIQNLSVADLSDCSCLGLAQMLEFNIRYSNLLFLQKRGKHYTLLSVIYSLPWDSIVRFYIPLMNQLKTIDHTKNLQDRYTQSIDWYINYGCYPDESFIHFYEQKGIIPNDSLPLSEDQLQRALADFLKGKEGVMPFIKDRFSFEVNHYYLGILKKTANQTNLEFNDYYRFSRVLDSLYDFDYDSTDYLLRWQITSDIIDQYDKKKILNYFIQMLENDIEKAKVGIK